MKVQENYRLEVPERLKLDIHDQMQFPYPEGTARQQTNASLNHYKHPLIHG